MQTSAPASLGSGDDRLDIRIALVLYGGVSLAIYENGVTRCFCDLARKKGIFSILLDLMDATAQVDTIAGTSAGGINGLLLAATLESGGDFTDSMQLWRDLGDLGDLMRDLRGADEALSLLKGETYYQDSLIEAFRKYCKPPEDGAVEYEGEIDVFITGTDLDGQERRNWDALGNVIYDKEHRVVFQLQHRAFRKALGYVDREKAAADAEEQGTILGTIARITSSFPAAFPPFRLDHLDAKHGKYRAAVQTALSRTARWAIEKTELRSFADGGLLDNKPFGPVLEAIFHRMPTDIVDRRLFYVEPDPEPRPDPPDPARHTPLNIAATSVASIPSHESIWGDLQALERHNAQVRWLKTLKQAWLETLSEPGAAAEVARTFANPREPAWAPYWQTRVESLSRSFFLTSDALTPFADDDIDNPAHRALAETLGHRLRAWITPPDTTASGAPAGARGPVLNSFDVDFHLRCSFHVLYELFETLQQPAIAGTAAYTHCRTAMRLVGRVIKTQKLIRDLMLELRRRTLGQIDGLVGPATAVEEASRRRATYIANLFRLFLRADAPHWAGLAPHLGLSEGQLRSIGDNWTDFFRSQDLSAVAAAARSAAEPARLVEQFSRAPNTAHTLAADDLSVRRTILDDIERVMRRVLDAYCRDTEALSRLAEAAERFAYIDVIIYPLEFVGAVYALDEIEYVRISPQDAQTGLSAGAARDKVAGDELFHFSAFLRKDWRSNDILQGRLDGICQIVRALLAPTARTLRRVQRSCRGAAPLFDAARRTEIAPGCSEESWQRLAAAWERLAAILQVTQIPDDDNDPVESAPLRAEWDRFCTQLVIAGQEDAFQDTFPKILEDHYYQEMAFGNLGGPDCATAASSRIALEGGAKKAAREQLEHEPPSERWELFRKMRLGSQPLEGRESAIPPHIVGEYVTHTYLLLWGMVRRSLGSIGKAVLDQTTVRAALRHPLAFINLVFFLMRRSDNLALGTIVATAGLLIGVAGAAVYLHSIPLAIGAVVVLLLFMAIVARALPRVKRWSLAVALTPLFIAVLLAVAGVILIKEGAAALTWRDQLLAFLFSRPTLVGFAAGAIAATVAWVSVCWLRRRRPA
jgi:patatin-related protein